MAYWGRFIWKSYVGDATKNGLTSTAATALAAPQNTIVEKDDGTHYQKNSKGGWDKIATGKTLTTIPTADKLATARTIGLGGSASGSVSFDGSSNVVINATVTNDSHTHNTAYYTKAECDTKIAAIAPPAPVAPDLGDPYYGNVTLLLKGDGTNNSTTFIDNSCLPRSITRNGDTKISTTQSKFGGSSMYFDGSGDYLTATDSNAFIFGTGDFTIEAWIYPVITSDHNPIFSTAEPTDYQGVWFGTNAAINLHVALGNGSWVVNVGTCGALTLNTWQHVALTRSGNTFRTFVNGVQTWTVDNSLSLPNSNNAARVGGRPSYSQFFNGYIDDLRVTKGIARYTSNFTPPTTAYSTKALNGDDLYYSKVSLLLKGDGANNSTTFTDNSVLPKTMTRTGDAKISTAQSKFGGSSMCFDGSGDWIDTPDNVDFEFGASDFTIECWVYFNSVSGYIVLISKAGNFTTSTGTDIGWALSWWSSNNMLYFNYSTDGTNCLEFQRAWTPVVNTWYHIAACRNGNTLRLFVNGTQVGANCDVTGHTFFNSTSLVKIGSGYRGGEYPLNGYMDDIRITKGVARYLGDFTPPDSLPSKEAATPDPFLSEVTLLLKADSFDKSPNRFAMTRNGDAQPSQAQKKYGYQSWYFDGSGDYLSTPASSSIFPYGTDNFTVEAWIYPITISGAERTIFTTSEPSDGSGIWFGLHSSGNLYVALGNGGWIILVSSCGAITLNTWQHVALTRSGNTFRTFVNGVQTWTTDNTFSLIMSTYACVGGRPLYSQFFNGYIDDLRVTKGIARYTTSFVPPGPLPTDGSDPYWSYVSLLVNAENIDSSPNPQPIAWYGNTQVSTAQSKFGGSSFYFDGSGDYLKPPDNEAFRFGTGDFTIEMWFYAISANTTIFYDQRYISGCSAPCIYLSGVYLTYYFNEADRIGGPALSANTWYHIALCRSSGTTRMFLNGTQVGSDFVDSSNIVGSVPPYIGIRFDAVLVPLNGYIDDLRITKGVARYKTNFVPPGSLSPVAPLATDSNFANVSLLLKADGFDKSIKRLDVARYGNAQPSQTQKKYGNQSFYFDGSGDYLKTPNIDAFNFGTGDFTIELWFNVANPATNSYLYDQRLANGPYPSIYVNGNVVSYWYNNTIINGPTIIANTWYHVAVARSSGTTRMFVNGIKVSNDLVESANIPSSAAYIGMRFDASSWPLNGYIDDVRVTKGIARYTANFTPPGQLPTDNSDPYWGSVVLLLNAEDIDSSPNPKAITWNGNTQIQTSSTQTKFGGGSFYFDENDDYLTVAPTTDVAFGTGDFTIEFWVMTYVSPVGNGQGFFQLSNSYLNSQVRGPGAGWEHSSGRWGIYYGTTYIIHGSLVPSTNKWYHVAYVRSSGISKLYVDGTEIISVSDTTNYTDTYFTVGGWYSTGYLLNGHIDDFRVTKGFARYTSNFTPPGPLPVIAPISGVSPTDVQYLVVAGGGGGGCNPTAGVGGGGGAGGYKTGTMSIASATPITVSVGAGGSGAVAGGGYAPGAPGNNSVFGSITSTGGGYGNSRSGANNDAVGGHGGSGGGGDRSVGGYGMPTEGNNGGTGQAGPGYPAGGGGGSSGAGQTPANGSSNGGNGGAGTANTITGQSLFYAAGGGGSGNYSNSAPGTTGGVGGSSIGGNGGTYNTPATAGAENTGSGGGGVPSNTSYLGQAGGSGVVIIAYPSQYADILSIGPGLTYTKDTSTRSGYKVYKFTV